MRSKISKLAIILAICLSLSSVVQAADVYNDYQGTYNAKVVNVLSEEEREIGWNNTTSIYRMLEVEILEGQQKGRVVTFETDFPKIKKGDKVFLNQNISANGLETFTITNIDRRSQLYFFVGLFILTIIIFGGWQGVRSLIALFGSFLAIFYILIPGILHGWSPLLASFLVASGILFAAIFFTHGFNRESAVAYFGTMVAVLLTLILALVAVHVTRLSGFTDDAAIYLNFSTSGNLNFTGLLLGAIVIGILGVLDDIAVTQAAVVTELYDSNREMKMVEVYRKAMRIGREHVGALVNTLVLAYTGTALPLLLLMNVYEYKVGAVINMEAFATEIIRTVIGSIGLVLTVPIVTLLASFYLKNYKSKHSHSHGHSHGHSHDHIH